MLEMFRKGKWADAYGGNAWGNICKAGIDLKQAVNSLNLRQILLYIDRLNDLEHNNALYLGQYSTFYLEMALDLKQNADENEIFSECSYDIQKLTKGINVYE
jgi:hypothetical protein